MSKAYKIRRFDNFKTHEEVYIYQYPAEQSMDKEKLNDLKSRGFVQTGVQCTNKEGYLNHKLNERIRDYLFNQRSTHLLEQRKGTMPDEVYWECMYQSEVYRLGTLKSIARLVKRLEKEGLKVYNEYAKELYSNYL